MCFALNLTDQMSHPCKMKMDSGESEWITSWTT